MEILLGNKLMRENLPLKLYGQMKWLIKKGIIAWRPKEYIHHFFII